MSIPQQPCIPIIIGVSGRKQSGKSTLCEHIRNNIVPSSNVYSFADPIKNMCINVLGLSYRQCYGDDKDKNSLTKYKWDNLPQEVREKYGTKEEIDEPIFVDKKIEGKEHKYKIAINRIFQRTGFMTAREVLQVMGTEIFREMFDKDVWVDATIRAIKGDPEQAPQFAFISDVRFKSEVNKVMKEKGYIIHLTRKVSEDNHSSEVDLDDFDFSSLGKKCLVIDNNSKEVEYKNKIALDFIMKIISGEI